MEPEERRRQVSDSDALSDGFGWDAAKDSYPVSYIKTKSHVLNRKKDIVSLILSYPPLNSLNRGRHEIWIQDVLKIIEMVREMEVASEKKNIDAWEVSSQITKLLDHTLDDLEAYVPKEVIDKMCKKTLEVDMSLRDMTMRLTSSRSSEQEAIPPTISQDEIEREMTAMTASHDAKISMHEKLLNLVVDFALRQILQEIDNPKLQRIRISGQGSLRVLSKLMNQSKIRGTFDVVVQVNGLLHTTTNAIEGNIAAQLGLSAQTGLELDELLKGANFLILIENINERLELYQLGINWWNPKKIQKIVSTTRLHDVHQRMLLDLEISMDDHLVSWELFCLNVGNVVHSSVIQRLAIHAVLECKGHLLAIVLLARALKEVTEIQIWEYASYAMALQPATQVKDEVLFNTLAFVCGCLGDSERNCLRYIVEMVSGVKLKKVNLIGRWIAGGLIGKLEEGEKIIRNLVDAFLLESSWNGDSIFIQMRGEIREVLHNLFGLEQELFLWLGGKELIGPPNVEAWEKAIEVHLMNNKLFELPKNLFCPQLRALFLGINHHLRAIPTSFFEHMPILQILDLSHTRIRSLPQSLFELVQLRILLLRGCRLLMELPPSIGELSNLEVLDLEGTEIISLPINVGQLVNLKCLKVSFHVCSNRNRKNNQSNTMIPQNVIKKLFQLEELCIYVCPDDERWSGIAKDIVKEVCSLQQLKVVKLYLPKVILLNDFVVNRTSSINFSSLNFKFIVGTHSKRFISRLPHEIVVKFEQKERCLMYVNGEGVPIEIKEVLQYATALHLDRHLTLTKLSEFGFQNIRNLKFCVLGECREIESIVDGGDIYTGGDEGGDAHTEVILGSLQYLRVYYMKNLHTIWKGPIQRGCLSNLKSLELHACPNLNTILKLDLLENLNLLEELVVERCSEIVSIVTHEIPVDKRFSFVTYLPKLQKLSLHYLPKLVSISNGLSIGPTLEWMSFYNCPSLQTLSDREVCSNNLRVIVGEVDWWRGLKCSTSASQHAWPCNLDSIFVPIKQDVDLMTQLAEISIRPYPEDTVKAFAVEAGTSSEVKQLYELESDPLSPFSSEEDGSIIAHSEDTVKALAVEAGTSSEVKQLYEPVSAPLSPFSLEEDGSIIAHPENTVKALAVEAGTSSKVKLLYEPESAPLSPFSSEEDDYITTPTVETGATSKENQVCEHVSLFLSIKCSDSMEAPKIEEHICEATPLPSPREGGDSIQADELEAETTLKKTHSCVPAKSEKKRSSSANSESADAKDFGQSWPSNHTAVQNLQQKNSNSKPILLQNDENYYSQKIPQFQKKGGSNGMVKGQMVGSYGKERENGGDIRDLEELLSKLNPMAEEFVPPSLANGYGWPAGGAFGYTNNFILQPSLRNANGNAGRRKWNNYNQKRRMNSRTSLAQREEVIKRTVYVSDIDQQVTEENLAALFISCGQVVDCRICGDPNSVLRFAFVEFTDEEGARAALSLAGTMLGCYPVRVLPSKSAIAPVNPALLPGSENEREMCARTIYCTNIDKKMSQGDVKLFFESVCGEVHRLRLLGDYHHSTRIAFVEFVQAESAIAALNCSGALLGNLPIRVSPSKTPVRPRAPRPALH